jgi:hypothetical protein
MKHLRNQSGIIMPLMIATGLVVCALGFAIAEVTVANLKFTTHEHRSQAALDAAEAGVDYYLWHLAHNTTDYQDGTGAPTSPPYGPYTHTYTNVSGDVIGKYTLYITPPSLGSTVTTVKSVGESNNFRGTRTIQAQIGIPSFAGYGLVSNTALWFGASESTSGPIHSNVGIRMDGQNNGPVTSATSSYKPNTQSGGDGQTHNGVWGSGGPTSQWQFPVPAVDFSKITTNLQTMITQAQANGVYLGSSGKQGYYLKLKADGKIDIYTVKNETSGGISTTFVRTQDPPANGCFYASDNVWVDGSGYKGRMTIGSGRLPDVPATNTTIKIVGNLTYAAKDGTSALGLIAQNNVEVATYAPSTLQVNGALLAQKGNVYYPQNGPVKTSIDFYGSIASNDFWTWTWVGPAPNYTVQAGYTSTNTVFDTHMTFNPPPCYPTTGSFSVLNWREVLTNP